MSEKTKKQTPESTEGKESKSGKETEVKESFKPGQVFKPGEAPDLLFDDTPEQDPQLLKLYEKSFDRVHEGDIIEGTVVAVTEKDVVVDVGFKSEGMIPKDEFIDLDNIKVGDNIEVFLENPEDIEGQVLLSRRKVYFLRTWENLINKHQNDEMIKGRIVRRIKGGFVVDLGGVDAFLPGSQVDVKPIRDFDAFVGQDLDLKIVKVNEMRKNIVVSRRIIIEKTLESKRGQILETLQKGQVRRGMVKNITDFGVFIDLGGVDGLLHITDLSWGRVNHPSEVVKLDQELDVMILDFDENKSRISLGLKQLQPHPWENVEERFPIGSKIKGRVVSLADYGAFVELEKGIEGLIHVSEMSWSQHIKNPSQIMKEGDEVEAIVLNIETDDRKISLGLKQLTPDPWEKIQEKYPVQSRHQGIVRNLTPFGAFVELEEGVDGLVHISDLSWTKKVRHPSEVVKKNQEIEVVVLDINKEERRIALGHKQVEANPWDTFQETYNVGIETAGKISRLIDKGVIVTLPLGVDAFVPLNHLGKPNIKRASDHFKVGDDLPLKVIEFDKDNKRIVLSVSEYMKGKEKVEVDGYMSAHNFAPTTMGELVKDVPEVLEGVPDEEKGRERPVKKHKSKKPAAEEEAVEGPVEEPVVEVKSPEEVAAPAEIPVTAEVKEPEEVKATGVEEIPPMLEAPSAEIPPPAVVVESKSTKKSKAAAKTKTKVKAVKKVKAEKTSKKEPKVAKESKAKSKTKKKSSGKK
jgi:small subunit ribosomal protein S1